MPSILTVSGWRLYFYSNENDEPVHIHARKGGMECKFQLIKEEYDIQEVWSNGLTISGRREIRKIIFENFEYIIIRWDEYFTYL
jgi:hypothetical protein